MIFRTEYEARPDAAMGISHADSLLMLGSCFTDNIGAELEKDGFDAAHNPMGPLYNPASIRRAVACALGLAEPLYRQDEAGAWHCLDFASRYSAGSLDELRAMVGAALGHLRQRIAQATIFIFTLGTAYVYSLADGAGVVGNCHKFPASSFDRRMLSIEQAKAELEQLADMLPPGAKTIFTVSPIRHTADGLHGNQLSKATLLMAIDGLLAERPALRYFPAYEIVIDDLRDYRFYAADMKHPSETAVAYIYDKLGQTCFSPATRAQAAERRKAWLRSQHRPLK